MAQSYIKNVLPKYNRYQIDDALQKCGGDSNKAILYLNSRTPPNIIHNKLEWFRFFDPFQCGLDKEDLALALDLTFGNGLHTTMDFSSSLSNIWGNFVPPGVRISGEVFADDEGLGDAIVDYIAPIYIALDTIYPCFHPSIPRQRIHDVLISSNGDKDVAVHRLQQEYPLSHYNDRISQSTYAQGPPHGGARPDNNIIQGSVVNTIAAGHHGSGIPASVSYNSQPVVPASVSYSSSSAAQPSTGYFGSGIPASVSYNSQPVVPASVSYSSSSAAQPSTGYFGSGIPASVSYNSQPVVPASVSYSSSSAAQPSTGYFGSGIPASVSYNSQPVVPASVSYPSNIAPNAPPPAPLSTATVAYTTCPPAPCLPSGSSFALGTNTLFSNTHVSPHSGYRPPAKLHPPIAAPPLAPVHPRPPRPPIRRALLIGINYTGMRGELRGCQNDTVEIRSLLTQTFDWPDTPQSIRVLTDSPSTPASLQPTKQNIMAGLEWLSDGLLPGDALFFHYSGHGAQQEDPDGLEEDGMNETILPVDYNRAGMITDDELSAHLVQTLPDGVRLTAVMDSCHSGTGLDLPYSWNAKKGVFEEDTNPYHSLGDVVLFSGCEDDSTSCDVQSAFSAPGGAMTTAFVGALRKFPHPTYDQLLDELQRQMRINGFNQVPQMSSSQEFDFGRPFLLFDALPNSNMLVGRTINKRFRPGKGGNGKKPGHGDAAHVFANLMSGLLFGL